MKEFLEEISSSVKSIYHETLDPIEDRFAFEKRPSDGELIGGPTVLVVGNHSSGKSTFLNFLLGEEIQKTGMAPTDDGFTILRYSEQREERDGLSIVSNPELPYAGLEQFGHQFLTHFKMKLLPAPLLKEVTLIDSPGMIDAADKDSSRGYDFANVVRWLADRADVILVFFDPDRPGTTAESLTILTEALSGFDHKLLVVMNKMDAFRSMRDFARCYVPLCWNLRKVIRKKDIPQIYTTFVPVEGAPEPILPLDDFKNAREELIEEIRRSPIRRVDNMITQTHQHAKRLQMHTLIIDRGRTILRNLRRKLVGGLTLLSAIGVATAYYFYRQTDPAWTTISITLAITALLIIIGSIGIKAIIRQKEKEVIDDLNSVFLSVYKRDLVVQNQTDDLEYRWKQVKPITERTLRKLGLRALPSLRSREEYGLKQLLNERLPNLRARLHRALEERAPRSSVEKGIVRD